MSSTDLNFQSIQSALQTQSNTETKSSNETGLGKDQFLKLLTTQLEYQDPMNPMDNKEFISQMAQFSSLEQMHNLNSTMGNFMSYQKLSQASSLLGKQATVVDSATGEDITGTIDKVTMTDGSPKVVINDNQYSVSSIKEVTS